jgi:hypothetical protein
MDTASSTSQHGQQPKKEKLPEADKQTEITATTPRISNNESEEEFVVANMRRRRRRRGRRSGTTTKARREERRKENGTICFRLSFSCEFCIFPLVFLFLCFLFFFSFLIFFLGGEWDSRSSICFLYNKIYLILLFFLVLFLF